MVRLERYCQESEQPVSYTHLDVYKRQELDRHGYKYSWEYMHPGHVRQQVRTAVLDQRAEIVVVVGGDGSIFEVINAIVENGTLIKEGLIVAVAPSGSACDFARHIYPRQQEGLWTLLEHGKVNYIDLGCCRFQQQDTMAVSYTHLDVYKRQA